MHDPKDTVVAVATPPGRGGVACLRLSGPAAFEIGRALHRPIRGVSARAPADRGAPPLFGRFVDSAGRELDHGYLVLFPAGASFSGEETAELWSHGSPPVLAELLAVAVAAGAVPAAPGEFTFRAVRNGRIDLARAEAVRDLVEARTSFQARVAFAQADGALSRRLAPLREALEEWIARGEAAVEFVEESETHLTRTDLGEAAGEMHALCRQLLDGFGLGRVVLDGATLAMIGRPNVGKSSLFNRLLERERAIVTEIAGTTRDTLEEMLDLDGVPLRLIDTAGLRDVDDPVEREGVRRAEHARREADLVLLVLDGSRAPEPDELAALSAARASGSRTLVVIAKGDLPAAAIELPAGSLRVSALSGEGVERLRAAIRERLLGTAAPVEDPLLTNARHAEALRRAATALDAAAAAARAGLSEELVLEDLRLAMSGLSEITGEMTTDALYDRIFSTFCLGK